MHWQVEHGIQLEHVYQATAHAKDLSDSECGGAKHAVEKAQLKAGDGETSIVKTPYEAYKTIRDGYGKLSHERFIKKGGRWDLSPPYPLGASKRAWFHQS